MEQTEKKKIKKRVWCFLLLIILIPVIVLAVWRRGDIRESLGRFFDPNVVSSEDKPKVVELDEIRRGLQQEADSSYFRVKINSVIAVDAEGKAELLIANSSENRYNMQVTITGEDGEEYYRSGELAPGEQVLTDTLKQKLSEGRHPAIVYFYALEPETGEIAGEVTAEVVLEKQL